MKRTILIIADLGNFDVYQCDDDPLHSGVQLELINAFETMDARGKRANTLTPMEKRSARQANNPRLDATGSDGEQHNMQLEKQKRLIRQMACRIADHLKDDEVERCFLAIPQEINNRVIESIAPDLREKIEKNVPRDLTHLRKGEIIRHFAGRPVHSPS